MIHEKDRYGTTIRPYSWKGMQFPLFTLTTFLDEVGVLNHSNEEECWYGDDEITDNIPYETMPPRFVILIMHAMRDMMFMIVLSMCALFFSFHLNNSTNNIIDFFIDTSLLFLSIF